MTLLLGIGRTLRSTLPLFYTLAFIALTLAFYRALKILTRKKVKKTLPISYDLEEAKRRGGKSKEAAELIAAYNWRKNHYRLETFKHLYTLKVASEAGLPNQEELALKKIKGCIFQDFAAGLGLKMLPIEDDIWALYEFKRRVDFEKRAAVSKEGYVWELPPNCLEIAYLVQGFPYVEDIEVFTDYKMGKHCFDNRGLAIKVAGLWYEFIKFEGGRKINIQK